MTQHTMCCDWLLSDSRGNTHVTHALQPAPGAALHNTHTSKHLDTTALIGVCFDCINAGRHVLGGAADFTSAAATDSAVGWELSGVWVKHATQLQQRLPPQT